MRQMPVDRIAAEALALPRPERERVAEALLASLGMAPVAEAAWTEEIRRRIREIDSRETRLIPGEDVLREGEELLSR